MHETGKKLLSLMFKPGETVCVSHNKYGYHSIPLEEVLTKSEVTLVPTEDSCAKRNLEWIPENFDSSPTDKLTLVSLNPVKGFREDINVTAYRSFLIEMDYGPLAQQLAYAKAMGMPYSAVVFSGNKSLHFLITLDQDLPSYEVYYHMAEWILGTMTMADPNTKNPTRSIRIPGVEREPGKLQRLVELNGPVKLQDLSAWLRKHPEGKPETTEKRAVSEYPDLKLVKPWVGKRLRDGLDPRQGRNTQWYAIACEFALAGFSEDDTIDKLRNYFTPDRDFKEREWKVTIRSAFKNMLSKRS